jgi:hypothetical protein
MCILGTKDVLMQSAKRFGELKMVGTWFVNFGPNTKHGYRLRSPNLNIYHSIRGSLCHGNKARSRSHHIDISLINFIENYLQIQSFQIKTC